MHLHIYQASTTLACHLTVSLTMKYQGVCSNRPISVATVAMFTSGKYRAAVNIWNNLCLVRYRELLGTHPFTASLLHYIGDAYQKLGDARRAVAVKRESLAMRKFLLGNFFPAKHCCVFKPILPLLPPPP